MAWTVPNGCYYAVYAGSGTTYYYYNASSTVPTERAPNNISVPAYYWVLIDFNNGYIYTGIMNATININNNTFTVSKAETGIGGRIHTNIIASADALFDYRITLAGSDFAFGDGSGMLNKTDFLPSGREYFMKLTFSGRTDITSVTIPSGVYSIGSCFEGCTSLTTAPTIPSSVGYMVRCFYGCTSLTTAPVIPNSITDMESCFFNCTSLTTAPAIPSGVTDMSYCFYGCTSLTTAPTIPSGVTDMRYCFRSCTSLTTAPAIPSYVIDMESCFRGCTSLTTSPTIPSSVTNMVSCFSECVALTTPPAIPSSVTDMSYCFSECISLTTAPTIPSSVTNMVSCFSECVALVGAVTINSNTSSAANIFYGTVNEIVLLGSGGSNALIASQYANVYVWSLSSSITAQRDESVLTSVDIFVDVTRFNTGTLTSLSLYKNGGQTPLSVTWNDPTLTITGNPTTFTTTITGIAESDTPTISVIATDQYGSSTTMSVNIPIAFYTMDVQAGGKEIAFGAIADDNLTNYPPTFDTSDKGLFKCDMTMVNTQMVGEIKMWAGNNAPIGWLVCDGSAISRTDYPLLFDAIGTLWGAGDGSTTFNLPNLQGRVPVGQDTADTDFDTVGDDGGSKYIQQHSHSSSFTRPTISSGGSWYFEVTALGARTGSTTLASAGTNTTQSASKNTRYKIANNSDTASGGTSMIDKITHGGHAHGSTGGGVSVGNINTSGLSTGSAGNLQPYAVVKYIICAI